MQATPRSAEVSTELDRRVAGRLEQGRIRYTRARRLTVRALSASKGPVSAADLQAQLHPAVPLSSLYRTVAVLDEAGILQRSHDADGVARFELAEWLGGHHHHLVCTHCGAAEDLELEPSVEGRLRMLAEQIGEGAGLAVTGHRLDLEGRCSTCR